MSAEKHEPVVNVLDNLQSDLFTVGAVQILHYPFDKMVLEYSFNELV